ncbi:MAG: GNAT family N-acetyltransferase [Rickettsiales bacterium]|nr:GNAT family N-acetyltransferase [Rickettsiales bacterium]
MSTHKSSPVTIHKAEEKDADKLTYLAHELAEHEGMNCKADANSFRTLIKDSKQSPECELFTAKCNNEIVAFALIYPGYDLSTDAYGYHLADIIVQKEHRGQGIGTQIMKFLAIYTLRQGREWISLTALEQNERAIGFYESLHMVNMPIRFLAAGRNILSSMGAE